MTSKHLGKMLGAIALVVALTAMMAATAQAREPAAGYSQFAGCPSPEENASLTNCLRSTVTGGYLKLGNKNTPITKAITLSGGSELNFANFQFNSKGGLSKAQQTVPGGVVGLTGLTWLLELLGSEALTLHATTELAGKVEPSIDDITLPIKVHLENGTLGSNCYVGSTSNPIVLHLTDGKSGSLTGVPPALVFEPKREIFNANNGHYVDGVFSAPGASGCVLTLFGFIPISINGLVNTASGLPAPTGNATEQIISSELVERELVYP